MAKGCIKQTNFTKGCRGETPFLSANERCQKVGDYTKPHGTKWSKKSYDAILVKTRYKEWEKKQDP